MLVLALGDGGILQRIKPAYDELPCLPEEAYPACVRDIRGKIQEIVTRLPGAPGYVVPQNFAEMDTATARDLAELIWEMFSRLRRESQFA